MKLIELIKVKYNKIKKRFENIEDKLDNIFAKMRKSLIKSTEDLGDIIFNKEIIEKQIKKLESEKNKLESKVKELLKENDEEKASIFVKNILDLENDIKNLREAVVKVNEQEEELKAIIKEKEEAIENFKIKRSLLTIRSKTADILEGISKDSTVISDNNIISEMEEIEEGILKKESMNKAYSVLKKEKEEKVEISDEAVKERLKQLKKEIKN